MSCNLDIIIISPLECHIGAVVFFLVLGIYESVAVELLKLIVNKSLCMFFYIAGVLTFESYFVNVL